jgi:hypothetical protein
MDGPGRTGKAEPFHNIPMIEHSVTTNANCRRLWLVSILHLYISGRRSSLYLIVLTGVDDSACTISNGKLIPCVFSLHRLF